MVLSHTKEKQNTPLLDRCLQEFSLRIMLCLHIIKAENILIKLLPQAVKFMLIYSNIFRALFGKNYNIRSKYFFLLYCVKNFL